MKPVLLGAMLALVAAAVVAFWLVGPNRPISYTGSPMNPSATMAALAAADRIAPPALPFTDAQGKPQTLAHYSGKVLLVNLWATWCPPCVAEMPSIAALSQHLAGDKFQVLAIALDRGGAPTVARWYDRNAITTLPIHLGNTADYQGALLPTSYLIDRQGKVAWQGSGAKDWASPQAMALVKQLMAESFSSGH